MLVHLHVKNLALIEDIEVEFGPGLNILTGETGAGKSILLGSMQQISSKIMMNPAVYPVFFRSMPKRLSVPKCSVL